jgi:hypothetical protein
METDDIFEAACKDYDARQLIKIGDIFHGEYNNLPCLHLVIGPSGVDSFETIEAFWCDDEVNRSNRVRASVLIERRASEDELNTYPRLKAERDALLESLKE